MSHFTVMVIGPEDSDELEEALAPFDENLECEPAPQTLEDDDISLMAEHYGVKLPDDWWRNLEDTLKLLQPHAQSWFGREIHLIDGKLAYITTSNPDSKWDWWALGGRWHGLLQLKSGVVADDWMLGGPSVYEIDPGAGVDRARKKDIDFAGKRAIERIKADNAYTYWENFVAEHGMPPKWEPPTDGDIKVYKHTYNQDPVVVAMQEAFPFEEWGFWFDPVSEFGSVTREEYVKHQELGALMCYATLFDGEWIAPGNMGWWGLSTDDQKSRVAYNEHVHKIIDDAHDDTVISIVDCHI